VLVLISCCGPNNISPTLAGGGGGELERPSDPANIFDVYKKSTEKIFTKK
jgi:hypothetical protein